MTHKTSTYSRINIKSVRALVLAIAFVPAVSASAAEDCNWWHPYTDGFLLSGAQQDGPNAMLGYDGNLVVGGQMAQTKQGVTINHIARFDGLSWAPLGAGFNLPVWTLAEFEGDLIAAGAFTKSGTTSMNRVARWDGTQWNAMGNGLPSSGRALLVHDGHLFAGTSSPGGPGVLRWDGGAWTSIGAANGTVHALHSFEGELIAGGEFTNIGGVEVSYIARWDGLQWHPMGTDIPGWVSELKTYQGALIATGGFQPLTIVAVQWVGGVWSPVGPAAPIFVSGRRIIEYEDQLIVMTGFWVLRLNGLEWEILDPSGLTGFRKAVTVHDGRLLLGGSITSV